MLCTYPVSGQSWRNVTEGNNCTHLCVPDDVEKRDDVGSSSQVLQNLDLALDLLLLDGLEDLDDALLVVNHIDALEDLRVFTPACIAVPRRSVCRRRGEGRMAGQRTYLAHDLVVLEHTPA